MGMIGFRRDDLIKLWKHRRIVNENYFGDKTIDSESIVSDIEQNNTKDFVDSFKLIIDIKEYQTLKNFDIKKKAQLIEYIINQCVVFENAIIDKVSIYNMKDSDMVDKPLLFKRDEIPSGKTYIFDNRNLLNLDVIFPRCQMVYDIDYDLTNGMTYKTFVKSFMSMISLLSEKIMYSQKDGGYLQFSSEDVKIDMFYYPFDETLEKIYNDLFKDSALDTKSYDINQYTNSINIDRILTNACQKIYEQQDIKCSVMEPFIDNTLSIPSYMIRIMIESFPDDETEVEFGDILYKLVYYFMDPLPYMFIAKRHLAISFHLADNLKINNIDKATYSPNVKDRDNALFSQLKSSRISPTTILKNGKKVNSCRFMYKSYNYARYGFGIYILFPRKDGYLFANPLNCMSTSQYMNFQNMYLQKPV